MIKKPKVGAVVSYGLPPATYYISFIDQQVRTASLTSTGKVLLVHHDVLLDDLEVLDESQDSARIVRQDTEG
jgi:hypothetical protein